MIHLTNGNVVSASSVDGVNANENGNVDLTVAAAKPIMNAQENFGANTYLYWIGELMRHQVQQVFNFLFSKSTKLAKEYSTTLTWTIAEVQELNSNLAN